MKQILITGGTGCVGSNLAAVLVRDGCSVRVLRRDQSDLRALKGIDAEHRIGDVRDYDSLVRAMEGCDTVFHTAAVVTFARKRREEQFQVNVLGTRNVVKACLATGVNKMVHTSSIAALGHPEGRGIADETKEFNWQRGRGYKLSKLLAEAEVETGVPLGLQAIIVNPAVIVGERDLQLAAASHVTRRPRQRVERDVQRRGAVLSPEQPADRSHAAGMVLILLCSDRRLAICG